MKTQFFIASLAALIINTGFITVAENTSRFQTTPGIKVDVNPSFSFFRTHRQGRAGITSTWGLTSSTDVSAFIVERTYEDPTDPYAYWETVSMVPCTNVRSYKCTDTNIFPGFISYRVKATMVNGNEIFSEVSTVHIVSH